MYRLARSIGFRLDPERAHRIALRALRVRSLLPARRPAASPVEVMGLRFPNRVGLAAGYDKDATSWRALASLGFGHVEVGTVTPQPQQGNPPPRLHRLPEHGALVNHLGFPSQGSEAVARRIGGERPGGVVLGLSIGPNAHTPAPARLDDYAFLVRRFAPLADYLAVNVSSPNTAGLRHLESAAAMGRLMAVIVEARDSAGETTPVAVKLSPDLEDPAAVAGAAAAAGADGIIAGNSTVSRPGGAGRGLKGGLSGSPLRPRALEVVRTVAEASGLPVIACGGISSMDHAREAMAAGAALVQVYTGLVYRGPRLVREIAEGLAPGG